MWASRMRPRVLKTSPSPRPSSPSRQWIGETTGRFALLGEYWCGRCQVRRRRKRGQSAVDLMRLGALAIGFRPGIRVSYRHGAPQPSRRTRPSRAIPDTSLQTTRDVLGVCMLLSGTRAGRHEMVSSKGFKNASTSLTRLQCTGPTPSCPQPASSGMTCSMNSASDGTPSGPTSDSRYRLAAGGAGVRVLAG